MQSLLALPYEVQIVLFGGYIAYKIATIGRSVVHRTEDFLLQVLAFGTIGRLAVAAIIQASSLLFGPLPLSNMSENAGLLIIALGTITISAVAAMWWRKSLQERWTSWMTDADIYRDDHAVSVWASILEARAEWTYVQLHCDDGRVYEADFGKLPNDMPLSKVILNEDGVAMYVTRVHRPDDSIFDIDFDPSGFGATIDYFPRSTIKRIEIGWKRR